MVAQPHAGLWRRLILARPGEPIDTLTEVVWLQGPSLFGDLRQPAAAAVPPGALRTLGPDMLMRLAEQEGFAGSFAVANGVATWQRLIDYQPASLPDCGRLTDEGDLLIEEGTATSYTEYWQRQPGPAAPAIAMRLRAAADGRDALLVRHGGWFIYARNRAVRLPAGERLPQLVAGAATLAQAQDLLDCEVAFGSITSDGWRIERSTLPSRPGALLASPDQRSRSGRLVLHDCDASGRTINRDFDIETAEGDFAAAPAMPAPTPSAPGPTRPFAAPRARIAPPCAGGGGSTARTLDPHARAQQRHSTHRPDRDGRARR